MKGFKSYQSPWVLLLLVVVGGLLGSALGEMLGDKVPQLFKPLVIGINPPMTLDLSILSVTLGFTMKVNLASVAGFFLAYLLYRKI